jgi:tRNA (guanosine-2'-O-)-methyltransferase
VANWSSTDLKRLHRDWRRRTPARLAIGLDGVAGPFNVGAILRTAAAYRADIMWLDRTATGPENSKVGKTALGSDRYVDVRRVDDGRAVVDAAHAEGFRVIGVELAAGAVPLHELDLVGDICLMVGHEDRGLSRSSLGAVDALGFIPQLGRIGSLNVSAAMAIASYEWARSQWTAADRAASGHGESDRIDLEP